MIQNMKKGKKKRAPRTVKVYYKSNGKDEYDVWVPFQKKGYIVPGRVIGEIKKGRDEGKKIVTVRGKEIYYHDSQIRERDV